jgi:hypothetical protein
VQQRLADLGVQAVGNSIGEFDRIQRDDLVRYGKLAKANNIRVE